MTAHIAERVKLINEIYVRTLEYFTMVDQYLSGHDPDLYRELSTLATISIPPPNDTKSTLFAFGELSAADNKLSLILRLLDNTYIRDKLFTSSSTTFIDITRANVGILQKLIEKSRAAARKDADFITVTSDADVETAYNYIMESDVAVSRIARLIISRVTPAQRQKILARAEELKLAVIGAKPGAPLTAPITSPIDSIVLKHGFYPLTQMMPLEDLVRQYDISDMILITRVSGKSAIEFSIFPLISMEYTTENNLVIGADSGVNEQVIRRYDNVSRVAVSRPAGVELRGNDTSGDVFVLESHGDDKWRLMSQTDRPATPRSAAEQLLKSPPTTDQQYNQIQSDVILAKCYRLDAAMILAEYERVKKALPDILELKNTLTDKFLNAYASRFADAPRSNDQYRNFITDRDLIADIISEVMFTKYDIDRKNAESALSFIKVVHLAIGKFYKEINGVVNDFVVADRAFKEKSPHDLKRELRDNYRLIIRKTIDIVDGNPSMWKATDSSLKEFVFERA